jgi:uncharacterized protein (DUF58 family)
MIENWQEDREPTILNSLLTAVFVGVFLFLALLYRQNDFSLLAILILMVIGGTKAWSSLSATRIRCESAMDSDRVFPGDAITLATTIENGKLLPVWLKIIWSFDGDLAPVGDRHTVGRQAAAVLWHQTVKFQQTLVALRRGVYQVGPPIIRTSDFLGFFEKEASARNGDHIIVYPRLVALRPHAIRKRELFGVPGARSPVKDPVYILGTRDYQPSRPSRHIHWKASARHLILQEKVFEPSEQEKVLLTLDVAAFEKSGREDNFEHALEVVASLAVELDRRGFAVGLAANGNLQGGNSALIPIARGPGQIPAILETLARIQARPKIAATSIVRQFLGSQRGISSVHFCYEDDPSLTEMDKVFQERQIPVSFMLCRRNPDNRPSTKTDRYLIDEIRLDRSLQHESR